MRSYKHSPEVRKFMRDNKRAYRAKKKAKEAAVLEASASLAATTPEKEIAQYGR